MLQEFCKVVEKYWFFMAVKLALNMVIFWPANDINAGMDKTRAFQWISDEGWMDLVNRSSDLTIEEKKELFTTIS